MARKRAPFSEQESDAIIEVQKVLAEPVVWRASPSHPDSEQFEVKIFAEGFEAPLILRGWHSKPRWSFTLDYFGLRIRGIDTSRHRNPANGEVFPYGKIHKHRWTDRFNDKEVYAPEDIDDESLESIFRTFLGESNVRFTAQYLRPERL